MRRERAKKGLRTRRDNLVNPTNGPHEPVADADSRVRWCVTNFSVQETDELSTRPPLRIRPSMPAPAAADEADGEAELAALIGRMQRGDRSAVGEYVERYGPYLRRRARGRLGSQLRRMVDSLDMVSTIGRRLDRCVTAGTLRAEGPAQFNALLNRIMSAALVDKVRAIDRLRHAEQDEQVWGRSACIAIERGGENDGEWSDWLEAAMRELATDDDRWLLQLWLNDVPLFRIAEVMSASGSPVTPAAVRQRWKAVRDRLRAWAAQEESQP